MLAIVIILIISQIECVSALSATIVDADLIFVSTIGHGSKYAGIIYIALDGDTTQYPTYCIDIDISTQYGNTYELGGSGADPNIIWILNNYYPNTGLPDGLTNTEKGAAVQLAIWHFSNGLDLSSGTPGNVFAAARAIVDSVGSASIPQIPSTLGLSPASSTNPLGAQHTVTATVLDPSGSAVSGQEVTFSVTGANPTTNPVSVVTDANGQSAFTYTGANAGDDTIAATTSFIVPSGAIWIGATSSIQRLVMAQDVPRSLTQSASKRWRDLTAPTISSVVPSTNTPCGNENVDITAHVIDNIAVTSVTLVYTDQTGQHTVDMTGPAGSNDGDWVGSIPGHDAGTTVTYKILARDLDGNEVTSPSDGNYEVSWRDCAAPNILSVEPLNPCENEEVILTAHVTDDDGVVSVNLIYGSSTIPMVLQQGGTNLDGVWMSQSPIPGQIAGSSLEIQIEATDASDRSTTVSQFIHWRDCKGPMITEITPGSVDVCQGSSVDITAHVIDNVGVSSVTLVYTDQTGQHTVDMTGPAGSNDGDWVGSIPGHDAGTTVTYKILARDLDGNEVTSPSDGNYEVSWRDCAAPNILSVEPLNPCENEEVILTAHVTDDDGVVSVNLIYGSSTIPMVLQQGGTNLDGVWMSQSPIPGQIAGSSLEIQIEATDASDRSTTVSQFIHWRDCKGPMITEITPGSADVCQGSSVEITARVTGTANINEVHLVYADPSGTHDVLMDPGASDLWTYTLSGCPAGTTIEYYILAIDSSGQSTRSETYVLNWINCGITKSASSQTVSPGGLVTYTITYNNYLGDAVITEDYPDKMTFISAYPQPDTGTNNRWTIPLGKGTITVTLKVPASSNTNFNFEQEASGVGFVRSWKDLSTGSESYELINKVTMSSPNSPPQIATSSVTVTGGVGVELRQKESGSGEYSREDLITYNRKKNFIKEESNLSVKHQSTSFALPDGRTLNFNSTWNEAECVKNYLTSESLNELYRYSTKIDRSSLFEMEGNNTRMEVSSEFQGTRHMGYIKVAETDEKGHITLEKEASSDYTGSFKVVEKLGTTYTNGSTAITDVKHYDEPHLTIYQRSEQDATDSINLSYTVSILNDGNAALGPIYVRDVFPAGTYFLDASIKPSEPRRSELSESRYANWTFTHLPIGQAVTIHLRVLRYVIIDVPINVVYVSAGYNGQWINASNSTATNTDYLSCSPQGICTKAQAGGGWNPPNWGFDLSEDICGSCYRAGSNAQSNCAACNVGV